MQLVSRLAERKGNQQVLRVCAKRLISFNPTSILSGTYYQLCFTDGRLWGPDKFICPQLASFVKRKGTRTGTQYVLKSLGRNSLNVSKWEAWWKQCFRKQNSKHSTIARYSYQISQLAYRTSILTDTKIFCKEHNTFWQDAVREWKFSFLLTFFSGGGQSKGIHGG